MDQPLSIAEFMRELESASQGVGAGIRWLSPIGLIRIDGALAVTRPGTPFHLHFSIGPDL